jgi:hypothetical protein
MHGPTRFILKHTTKQVNPRINDLMRQEWTNRWKKSKSCRQTRYWFPERNPRQSVNLLKHGRITLGLLVQFMTGFNWLSYHQSHIEKREPPPCSLCGTGREETIHLVSECPALWDTRTEIFEDYQPRKTWTISQLNRFTKDHRVFRLLTPPEERYDTQ